MKPISHTGFAFGIIGSWIDIVFVLFIIYFAIKLFKSSRVLPYLYLLFIVVVLLLSLNIVL